MTNIINLGDYARPDDFKKYGTEHGHKCGLAIVKAIVEHQADIEALNRYHLEDVLPKKIAELQGLGASQSEIDIFIDASLAASTDVMAEFNKGMNKPQPPSLEEDLVTLFSEPLRKMKNGEFTLGCLAVEEILSQLQLSVDNVLLSKFLREVMGGYLACCCMRGKEPMKRELLIHPRLRADIMQEALSIMRTWESEPEMRLINYMRRLS